MFEHRLSKPNDPKFAKEKSIFCDVHVLGVAFSQDAITFVVRNAGSLSTFMSRCYWEEATPDEFSYLLGFNPSDKYENQIGSFSPGTGSKIKSQ